MDKPSSTSLTLLSLARRGDNAAWSRMVDVYAPLVYAQCVRKNLSEEDAQDVTQEVFVAIHGGLGTFRKERPEDKFSHWIRRITSNKIADRVRQLVRQSKAAGGTAAHVLIEQLPEEIESEWNPDQIRKDAFVRAVNLMKVDFEDQTWQAFELTVMGGKTTREACEILGMQPGAVRNARFKVRRRLVEELGDVLDLDV